MAVRLAPVIWSPNCFFSRSRNACPLMDVFRRCSAVTVESPAIDACRLARAHQADRTGFFLDRPGWARLLHGPLACSARGPSPDRRASRRRQSRPTARRRTRAMSIIEIWASVRARSSTARSPRCCGRAPAASRPARRAAAAPSDARRPAPRTAPRPSGVSCAVGRDLRQVGVHQVRGLAEHRGPGKEERDFDVEDDEQQRHDVEPQVELHEARADRRLAALVDFELFGVRRLGPQKPARPAA